MRRRCLWSRHASNGPASLSARACPFPAAPAEPPPDLLSLLARRVFASRSSLLQRLRSEGQLSDLQAANDSAQHTPSQGTLASPRSPPPQPQQEREQQQQAEGQRAEGPALPELHHLPRIRTRPARQGYGSSGSSSGR